ncbi:hypothetical protein B0T13DRAFT_471532 [Neurospora crassa]|nr:hypothetical protein B0T13DRAFT_471532 [Neurospora crassa]
MSGLTTSVYSEPKFLIPWLCWTVWVPVVQSGQMSISIECRHASIGPASRRSLDVSLKCSRDQPRLCGLKAVATGVVGFATCLGCTKSRRLDNRSPIFKDPISSRRLDLTAMSGSRI